MTALLDTLAIWSVPVAVLALMVGAYWMGRETRRDGVERWEITELEGMEKNPVKVLGPLMDDESRRAIDARIRSSYHGSGGK